MEKKKNNTQTYLCAEIDLKITLKWAIKLIDTGLLSVIVS